MPTAQKPTTERPWEVITQWAKPNITESREMCIVGKEAVAVAASCHVVFYNIETGVRSRHTANNREKGDGVACIAGHRTLPFIAFADRSLYPRILVFYYPTLDKPVTVLKGGALKEYQSIVFSESEYLVGLTGIPDFSIVVWAWRSGVKVACKHCGIEFTNQSLSCSMGSPILLCQTSRSSKQVVVWELNVSSTVCCLSRKEIAVPKDAPPPLMSCFTADGALVYIDILGNLYQVDIEEFTASSKINCWEYFQDQKKDILPWITAYKHGVLVSGANGSLKLLKRGEEWQEQWTFQPESSLIAFGNTLETSQVVGWTRKGEIVQIEVTKNPPEVTVLLEYGMDFVDAVVMTAEPWCVVSINRSNILQAFQRSGQTYGEMDLTKVLSDIRPLSRSLSLSSNPQYPYIAVSMSHGLLLLVNLINPREPEILAKFLLCDDNLDIVRFYGGNLFATANLEIGRVFMIQGEPGGPMSVIGHILLNTKLVDVLLTGDKVRPIIAHVRTEACCRSGNIFHILNFERGTLAVGQTIRSDLVYSQLVIAPARKFWAVGHRSRRLHSLRIQEGTMKRLESIVSGEMSMRFSIGEQGDTGLITYGIGGICLVRPPGEANAPSTIRDTVVVISHFRGEQGIKRAMKNAKGDYLMTLGFDGTLVLIHIKHAGIEPTESGTPSPAIVALFSQKTGGFFLEGEEAGYNWLKYQEKLKQDAEREAAAEDRAQILAGLGVLQSKIKSMLDANELAPPEEVLPLSAFDLDKEERENDMEQARDDRELLRTTMIAETTVRDRLSELIIKECWEKLSVKPTTIRSFSGTTQLENYPMFPESTESLNLLESIQERRKLEMKMSRGDIFHPWVSQDYGEDGSQSSEGSLERIPLDEKSRMMEALMRDEVGDGDAPEAEDESQLTLTGSTAYRFVEPSKYIITQMELNTYIQTASLIVLLRAENRKLTTWFNEHFRQAYAAKEKEMVYVQGLHEKIRHIFNELRVTCGAEQPDPEPQPIHWMPQEQPEKVLKVTDSELSVRPYGWIPPADQEQELDDEDSNFRKKALMTIMGGVLEVRWEDELKKDIPKPKFMLEKEADSYTEDEVRQVLEYNRKVDNLTNEREHYRKILLSQYRKVKYALKESSVKFEHRLAALRQLKLTVDGACAQTLLRITRSQLLHNRRHKLTLSEAVIKEEIAQNQKMLTDEQGMAMQMLDAASEIRSAYDAQVSRDRYLEIRFRKEFPEASPVQMELLQRAYRRRPKMQRSAMSSHLLNELGRHVITSKKPTYLPAESLEFLRGIDALDSLANTPANVNADLWTNLCRLRRQRIESELKVKAMLLQIVEADNTVAVMHRSVRAFKERDKELNAKLKQIHEEQLHFERDIEIQLVLKQGIVEIPMTGRIEDYENCVMIDRTEVAKLNDVIVEAGKKKLRAMRADCDFRRGIIYKEWEHRKMLMKTEDIEEELNAILTAKVPKEGQEWLAKKLRGITDDKFSLSVEREIAAIKTGFEKYIRELASAVRDYDDRIHVQNKINEKLQTVIKDVNVQVRQLQAAYDPELLRAHNETQKRKMELWLEKSSLVIQVREIDIELRCLENELNVLRRRYYPILTTRTQTVPWSHS